MNNTIADAIYISQAMISGGDVLIPELNLYRNEGVAEMRRFLHFISKKAGLVKSVVVCV